MVGFPLLLIPIAIYNIIVFLMPGVSFAEPILKLTLMSGTEWPVTLNDIMLALAVLMLLFEVIKGARPGAKFLMDHLLSLIVFGCAAAEFVLWPKFGNSTYCLLALLALVDFLSGIALRARRGTVVAASTKVSSRAAKKAAAAVAAEPSFEPAPAQMPVSAPAPVTVPAPASSVPAAASVAESVLLDRSEPKLTPPAVAANSARPEEVSPGLQPSNGGPPPSPDVLPPSR
jgi:hypothetical protein